MRILTIKNIYMEKYNRYKKLVRLVFACIIAGGVVFGYYKYLKHEQKRIAHEMTKEYFVVE